MITKGDTDIQRYIFTQLDNTDLFRVLAGDTLYIHANGSACTINKEGLLVTGDRTFIAREHMITGFSFDKSAVKKTASLASRIALPKFDPQEQAEKAIKDQAPKDQAPKDQAPKDQAPKDQAPKDQAPKDQAPKANNFGYGLED